jgi:hypothetical protein
MVYRAVTLMHCSKCISINLRELMCRWRCQMFLISLSLFHSIIFLFSPGLVHWCLPGCVNGDVDGRWTEQPPSLIILEWTTRRIQRHSTGMWNLLFDFPLHVSERPSVWFLISLIRKAHRKYSRCPSFQLRFGSFARRQLNFWMSTCRFFEWWLNFGPNLL